MTNTALNFTDKPTARGPFAQLTPLAPSIDQKPTFQKRTKKYEILNTQALNAVPQNDSVVIRMPAISTLKGAAPIMTGATVQAAGAIKTQQLSNGQFANLRPGAYAQLKNEGGQLVGKVDLHLDHTSKHEIALADAPKPVAKKELELQTTQPMLRQVRRSSPFAQLMKLAA